MVPDGNMAHGHLFPSNSCQSPQNIVYSPPLHHPAHRAPPTPPGSGQLYSATPHYRSVPYQPDSFWPPMSQANVTYSSYPPLPALTTAQPLGPESGLPCNQPVKSHSASSSLSVASHGTNERSPPPLSRSLSPSSPDLRAYGFPNKNGTWSCGYPGCTSRAVFTRGCDLRKHHKRHTKSFFCRHEGCPQATGGGFSSKKDLARHEAKHNPGVLCDWDGCDRVFSRVDNMVSPADDQEAADQS